MVKELESYAIVYPEIIDNSGGILVNDVKGYVRRRKRTLGEENKPLEISISGGGQLFDLELWENDNLFSPGFKIYHRQTLKQAKSKKELPLDDVFGCHFTGHLKGQSGNPASVSICNGLICSVSGLPRAHDHHQSNGHSNATSNSNHDDNTRHHTTVKELDMFCIRTSRAHDHHHSNQHINATKNSKHDDNTRHHKTVKTEPESYAIVYPEIIDNRDGILVNDVKGYVRRRKRTLGKENKPLEISISGGGQLFDLELWKKDNLFSPGFKIYHRQTLKQAKSEKKLPLDDVFGCHLYGHLKGQSGNPASVSICNGLVRRLLLVLFFLVQCVFSWFLQE